MDYKEKYEQALDRAKEMYDAYRFSVDQSNFKPTDFEYIFPELKESEDEKIRKQLLNWFKCCKWNAIDNETLKRDDIIAWLEKQGDKDKLIKELGEYKVKYTQEVLEKHINSMSNKDEEDTDFTIYYPLKNGKGKYECIPYSFYGSLTSFSEDKDLIDFLRNCFYSEEECEEWIKKQDEQKSSDKVEPKFKVGDWVVDEEDNYVYQVRRVISNVTNGTFSYDLTNRGYFFSTKTNCHLWTIQDAKNGDVLVCIGKHGQEIGLIKEYVGKYGGCDKCFETYCFVDWDGNFRVGEHMGSQNIHPATKEQRDLLFAKMKEAGYDIFQSWDSEKLELRKIEQKPNGDSWRDELANLNEKLAECSKYNVRILNTGDGLYMCNILDDGIEDEVYAENFYEDELYDLIDSVQNYLMNKINEQR